MSEWLGDVNVAWITSKDTAVSKETVEKNFVDGPPQVYELTPNLEAGSYSLILNQGEHARSETLTEQIDAIRSLPMRHVSEFPFDLAGDTGFIVPGNVSTSITPSETVEEATANLRFLEDTDYQPAIDLTAEAHSDAFSPTPVESIVAVPSEAETVLFDGSSKTEQFSLSTSDGTIELYDYQDERLTYDMPSSDYPSPERNAPVRAHDGERDSDGNYGEDYGNDYSGLGEATKVRRVYSDSFAFDGKAILDNGKILTFPTDDNWCEIYKYDSGWFKIGEVRLQTSTGGYLKEPDNYHSIVDFPNDYEVDIRRGITMAKFTFSGETEFIYETEFDLDTGTNGTHYFTASDSDGNQVMVVRTDTDGFFEQNDFNDIDTIEWKDLDTSKEYEAFAGFVPSGVNNADFARWVYNIGSQRRTMIQR